MGGPASGTEAAREAFRGPRHRRLWLARGISPFVGGKKATLGRIFREKGIVLTAEAQARLDVLPERFLDFIAAPEWFFARPEAEAA
jgi:hypothetical protein